MGVSGLNPPAPSGPEIILASASPRRADLLRQIGLPFSIQPSTLDEDGPSALAPGETPERRASCLALAKAWEVAAHFRRGLVVGADTMVVCGEDILGKPRDDEEARAFLLRLAGGTHRVVTGVAVVDAETKRAEATVQVTTVRMRPFGAEEAAAYVATGESRDKAGAYAIQGHGSLLVEAIQGDYFTVVGLPLVTLAGLLGRFGLDVWKAAHP
ncbi:MAG TPA: Maf family protein [Candidatus Acidoferrum sp.]|nr:Maf family protein [Candidatus Acidoferrum sp.]